MRTLDLAAVTRVVNFNPWFIESELELEKANKAAIVIRANTITMRMKFLCLHYEDHKFVLSTFGGDKNSAQHHHRALSTCASPLVGKIFSLIMK